MTHDFSLRVATIRPVFGEKNAGDITKQDIVRWLTAQSEAKGWAAATRNRWQAAFSLIFRVGVENNRIDRNPAAGIRRKTENNARVRFLSVEEEAALRKVVLERSPAYIHQLTVSLHTGMRAGEQFSLRWEQIDFERRIATLPKTKNGTVRHIPLNANALQAFRSLRELHKKGEGSDLIFPSQRNTGSSLQSARGWFRSALADAGIKGYTWHCNRHSFASRLVMAGVDIHTVGELLGHKSLAMTMRYSHLAPEYKAAAVDRLVSVSQTDTGTTTDTAA